MRLGEGAHRTLAQLEERGSRRVVTAGWRSSRAGSSHVGAGWSSCGGGTSSAYREGRADAAVEARRARGVESGQWARESRRIRCIFCWVFLGAHERAKLNSMPALCAVALRHGVRGGAGRVRGVRAGGVEGVRFGVGKLTELKEEDQEKTRCEQFGDQVQEEVRRVDIGGAVVPSCVCGADGGPKQWNEAKVFYLGKVVKKVSFEPRVAPMAGVDAHGLGRGARVDERARDSVQVEGLRLDGVARVVGRGVCLRERWANERVRGMARVRSTHSRLRASWCSGRGHRFFENVPGVYVFRDG